MFEVKTVTWRAYIQFLLSAMCVITGRRTSTRDIIVGGGKKHEPHTEERGKQIASHADELKGHSNLTLIVPSSELDEDPLLTDLQDEIERLGDLELDWNGEGARAVNVECIARARAVLRQAVCTVKEPLGALALPSVTEHSSAVLSFIGICRADRSR